MPARLRTAYFLEISEQAEQAYVPQPYPGRMVLFRGDGLDQDAYLGDDPEFGWGGLASGGLEIQLTPGADENRRDILHEPYVATVAEQLEACLQAAHVTCRDRSTGL